MKPIEELEILRHHLAEARLATAAIHIRSGSVATAKVILHEVNRLAPSLANPYVMLAKLAFWEGQLDSADENIKLAEARGFSDAQAEAMRGAVSELRCRGRAKDAARREARASRAALWDSIYRLATSEPRWFTPRFVASIVFFACMLLLMASGISS